MLSHDVVALKDCFKCWHALGRLRDGQEMSFAYQHVIKPMQIRSELERLLHVIQGAQPRTVVEIGTATGGTLFLFCRYASRDGVIVSIDLRRGRFGNGYPIAKIPLYKSFAMNGQRVVLIRGDSHLDRTYSKARKALMDRIVDFLFIDGDHTYDGVKADFEMYSKLVAPGGIIAFHDIAEQAPETGCQVSRYWNEIKHHHRHEEIIETAGQGWAGIGLLYL